MTLSDYKVSISMDDDFDHVAICENPAFKITGDSYKSVFDEASFRIAQHEAIEFVNIINLILGSMDDGSYIPTPPIRH